MTTWRSKMNIEFPDHHVSSLMKLLDRLRPGDYRDMASNRHEELALVNADKKLTGVGL